MGRFVCPRCGNEESTTMDTNIVDGYFIPFSVMDDEGYDLTRVLSIRERDNTDARGIAFAERCPSCGFIRGIV